MLVSSALKDHNETARAAFPCHLGFRTNSNLVGCRLGSDWLRGYWLWFSLGWQLSQNDGLIGKPRVWLSSKRIRALEQVYEYRLSS
jgi:hypothetical protein